MPLKKALTTLFFLSIFFFSQLLSRSITREDVEIIGEKIWQNECAKTVEGLTNWKKGETFASLGIGHFIWYPLNKKERFEETFPSLVIYLQEKGAQVPSWLVDAPCPWSCRDDFYKDFQSSKMQELRKLLLETKDHQALFMSQRLQRTFPKLIEHSLKKQKLSTIFSKLLQSRQGLYALIDYLNFKGSGISALETYQGKGWGLLQVLENISYLSDDPIKDFVRSAKNTLIQRVQNSPAEKEEDRWLQGWLNRVDTYTQL